MAVQTHCKIIVHTGEYPRRNDIPRRRVDENHALPNPNKALAVFAE